ncbi:hypothetical protein O181_005052 [Austropuccinia psidii MF-1]|uniref:Uncharacterized protein n=1 Tax=Austropuccinia psidii MF-1 TaxID=1389203 RepID=A0A9Q3BHF2_9BASI|nr:hypothetical protein [Austropuccinia psidii MF-1]
MDNRRLTLASNWEELEESCQKISLKDLMVITKCWNINRQFKLLEKRKARIRKNKATIQAVEEELSQKEHSFTASVSQGVNQLDSPVDSHHASTN